MLRLIRLALALLWVFALGLCALPWRVIPERWRSIRKICSITELWGKGLVRIFNIEVERHGFECHDAGGLVVSNHLGVLDIFVHASVFGFRFAPKADIRSWPLIGLYIEVSHPVWVDRVVKSKSARTLEEFRETLLHGIPLIVYPEGTSSDGKSGVLPFKSSPFEAVMRDNLPVRPVLTLYRVPAGSKTDPCWYGDMTLLPHLWDLLSAPGIVAELRALPALRPDGRDRKQFAKDVHDLLQREYDRVMAERASASSKV